MSGFVPFKYEERLLKRLSSISVMIKRYAVLRKKLKFSCSYYYPITLRFCSVVSRHRYDFSAVQKLADRLFHWVNDYPRAFDECASSTKARFRHTQAEINKYFKDLERDGLWVNPNSPYSSQRNSFSS